MKNQKHHEDGKAVHNGNRSRLLPFSAILIVGIAIGLVAAAYSPIAPKCKLLPAEISEQQASEKAVNYVNSVLQGQASAKMISINESGGLYSMDIDVGGQKYSSFMTKDGKMLFPSGINLDEQNTKAIEREPKANSIPKSDKPKTELFVMSFCPYGVQAEGFMKPVADLLGSKADIKVRFIAQTGSGIKSIQSLHGPAEASEDLRQLCIMKDYPEKYWSYLETFNKNCFPIYRNESALDSCWKSSAAGAGMDAAKIESCANADALALIKTDEQAASAYGVSGSPSLIINGAAYNGARSSEGFKSAICSAFNNQPAECSQKIETASQPVAEAPHAGCG